ncbi:MAG: murein transglycosylase A [Limnohabitans sp.]
MVHQTMAIRITSASRASSNNNAMQKLLWMTTIRTRTRAMAALLCAVLMAIVGSLSGCSSTPTVTTGMPDASGGPLPPAIVRAQSRWVPVHWSELPAFGQDPLHEAWPAWLRSCERPAPAWRALCPQLQQLSDASPAARQSWLRERLQPYRVESHQAQTEGLLTAYYEPLFEATRRPQGAFTVPLYAPPASLRKPWFTRQDIDTLAAARAALRGKELLYLNDPVDAMVLHIQGSGLLRVTESDGSVRTVRLAFAGTNEQPYKSIGRWLLDQGLTRDASWPGIKAWIARNPTRVQELLWQNPRYVFFREESLPAGELPGQTPGPKGAQGVPLTAGRSIAVDPGSIPYGTPVWLASSGPQTTLRRLVLAQDTGTAITGAVRADYYAGSGAQAGELAGRLKQSLQMWVLWPR